MISRRKVRERVLQALYAHALGGGDVNHVLETLVRPELEGDEDAWTFGRQLLERTIDRAHEADDLIRSHAENWELSRIALVDRLLLRLALCEFQYFEDIPPKVTINEAIDIGKRFSTDNSGSFINGILDAALMELKREGRLRKTGRGLIGTSD